MSEPAFTEVRRLLLLPLLLGFAAPVSAQSVYLKCTRYINHVDKGPNTPDHVWLTINPGQQFGNARMVMRDGTDKNLRASQFISSTEYNLSVIENHGSGLATKYVFSANRSNGDFTHRSTFSSPNYSGDTLITTGSCKKDVPATTLF